MGQLPGRLWSDGLAGRDIDMSGLGSWSKHHLNMTTSVLGGNTDSKRFLSRIAFSLITASLPTPSILPSFHPSACQAVLWCWDMGPRQANSHLNFVVLHKNFAELPHDLTSL